MKSPKEPEQYILHNDLTDSSAGSPLEGRGHLASLQRLLYEAMDTSGSLSELSSDKVMPELPSRQGPVRGGGFEQGSLCHREEDCDTAFRFQSLVSPDPQPIQSCFPSASFPDFLQIQPNLFQDPLEPMPRTGTGATVYRACCKRALDGMSGELYNAVDSIASEGSEDYSENVSYKQEMAAEHTHQSRMDMYQQVLCDINGAGQMVPLNSSRLGQTVHSIPINHMLSIAEHHFHTPAQRDTIEHSTTLSEVTPIQMVKISTVPGTCPVASPPYMVSPNLPLVQPASTFLVPPASLSTGLSYNSLPGPYSQVLQKTIGVVTDGQSKMSLIRFSGTYWDSKSKKPCNCTKSQCLKLYCECFANGDVCSSCNCINCCNNTAHESERYKAIRICLDRNPEAFHPKIGNRKLGESKGRHNKGCNCKRSGCLKNYCECYEAKIMCSSACRCVGCRNYEESPERRTLVSAGYEDDRNASVYMRVLSETRKCPLACITPGVVEATCGCLIAQAEEAEREGLTSSQAEKMILEEFGQCLRQIVQSIFKSGGLLA